MPRNTSVFGLYADQTNIADAVGVLRKAGFRTADVAVLASANPGTKDLAHERHSKAPAGAAAGALAGAAVGSLLAWMTAQQMVTLAGTESLVGAGPVLAALAGAGAGGALGWIAGLLTGLGFSDYVAKRYAGRVRRAGILLSVHCDSREWSDRAKHVLRDTGGRGISASPECAADYGTTDKPGERAATSVPEPMTPPLPPESESRLT